jgi:hypothetical protein
MHTVGHAVNLERYFIEEENPVLDQETLADDVDDERHMHVVDATSMWR